MAVKHRISAATLTELLIPAALLFILTIVPPHALDLSISNLFYENGWPWHRDVFFTTVFYKLPKWLPVLCAGTGLLYLMAVIAQGRRILESDISRRVLYVIVTMGVSAAAVWWLKSTTGVVCPWDAAPYGGSSPLSAPVFGFDGRPGNCWPAGHAGTGFVFFALYFAIKDRFPKCALAAGVFALLFGIFCGAVRVMEGAHFVSHVLATGLVDWLISATLAQLMLPTEVTVNPSSDPTFRRTHREPVVRPGALTETGFLILTALWWVVIFNAPFFTRFSGLTLTNFAWSLKGLLTLAAVGGGFLLLTFGLLLLIAALPRAIRIALLFFFAVSGGMLFSGEVLYGIVFDPDMARNVVATDLHEASTYGSVRTVLLALAAMLPPVFALMAAEFKPATWKRSSLRIGGALAAAFAGLLFLYPQMGTISSVMRTDRPLRYLIAPVNIPYSLAATSLKDTSPDAVKKHAVDPAPTLTATLTRPAVLLVAVGETTRSANWGLAGYDRNTTPELAQLDVVNHPSVVACGTSTDVSLPCMMSRIGRSNYDRKRILAEESLPSLLARAGAEVRWVDNQSGCKGTCGNVTYRKPDHTSPDCTSDLCRDGVLVSELEKDLTTLPADRPLVLFYHLYGQHGPRYHQDSPDEMKVWLPECRDADLGACEKTAVINAYDNAVRYTDHVLAELIRTLKARDNIDAGLVFVSDHGESLGENGLYLHGSPYFIAPAQQTHVPMVLWTSDRWGKAFGFDAKTLARTPKGGVTHEHLYSTVLGLLAVRSETRRADRDLTQTL